MSTQGPKPEPGKWTVMDVIERLVEAGTDAHLFIRFTIGGKNYDMNLADVEVTDMGSLPSMVTFQGDDAKLDEPVKVDSHE